MAFCLRLMVHKQHEWIDFIVATGFVPPDWSKRNRTRIARYATQPNGEARIEALNGRAVAVYLKKLDKLLSYMKYATLVESEQSRKMVIEQLTEAGEQWKKGVGVHNAIEEY